jgi:peptidoglycan/LPS O-acetylase OafA/YrhL
LGIEEPFYILAPFCFRKIRSKRALAWVFGVTAVLSLLFRFFLHAIVGGVNWGSETAFGAYFWTPARICAPALGCLLAVGWATPKIKTWLRNHHNILYFAIPSLLAVFAVVDHAAQLGIPHAESVQILFDRTTIVLAALCLVAVVLAHPQGILTRFLEWPVFERFGRISYCIYLTHWGILWLLARFVANRQFDEHPWLGIELAPLALLICWGLSELSWKYFEGPLVRRGQAHRYDPPLETQHAPANAAVAGIHQNPSALLTKNQVAQ